jgi:hypothetical protein
MISLEQNGCLLNSTFNTREEPHERQYRRRPDKSQKPLDNPFGTNLHIVTLAFLG